MNGESEFRFTHNVLVLVLVLNPFLRLMTPATSVWGSVLALFSQLTCPLELVLWLVSLALNIILLCQGLTVAPIIERPQLPC
jgi:hypothetical protein